MAETPGQADPKLFHWQGTWDEFDAEVRRRWIESSERLGLDSGLPGREIRTCYCGTTSTVVPGVFPHPDCDGSVRPEPQPSPVIPLERFGALAAHWESEAKRLDKLTPGAEHPRALALRDCAAGVRAITLLAAAEPAPAPGTAS